MVTFKKRFIWSNSLALLFRGSRVRLGQSSLAAIFDRSTCAPAKVIIWLKYVTQVCAREHFDFFRNSWWSERSWNTILRYCICSTHVLLNTKMLSKYTKMNLCKYGPHISFTRVWNVEGTLVSPNDITTNSNWLWCVRNVVLLIFGGYM